MGNVYKYVAVIGIDGMGNFNKNTPTPFMDEIFANGAVTYDALSMAPTISAQNWGAMLLGVSPAVHGLTNSIVSNQKYTNKKYPSVFQRIKDTMPESTLASFCNWNPINQGIIEDDLGVIKGTAACDEELCKEICCFVEKHKPEFLFVQFDDTDGAGHEYGYNSPKQLEKITQTDALVGRIYESYKKADMAEDTLFVVIADHGGIRVGHGGYTNSEKYIFLGVSGKTVKKGGIEFAYTKDIASIVLSAFGINLPQYNFEGYSSQVPVGIFENSKKYYIPEVKIINGNSFPTPSFKSENGLLSFADEDKLELALFFDESMDDATNKHTPVLNGKIKFYNGSIYGSYAELGETGCAFYESVKVGSKSFSLAFWAKIDHSLDGCPVVCGNKDWFWKNNRGKGFVFSFRNADTLFNISNGSNSEEYIVPFPENISDGWIHTTAVLDKEKKEYRCYYNFKHHLTLKVDDELICDLDALPFTVGDDGLGKYNSEENKSLVCVDDFLMFNDVLTEEDICNLKQYYNRE